MLRNYATCVAPGTAEPNRFSLLSRLADLARTWLERHRSRRALAELDERLMRDIGLSRSEAMNESVIPFWKPFTWLQSK
jgi:uncharacterized protein YjiS (DUF1127 family)